LALCHQQLRRDDKAIELFKHIKSNFYDSEEAALSSAYLSKITSSAPVSVAPKASVSTAAAAPKRTSAESLISEPLTPSQWKALPDTARIPFQMKHGHMYVQAKVNGRYCDIVFDTGASSCVMSLYDYPDLFPAAMISGAPQIPVGRPHGVVLMRMVSGEVTVDRVTRKLVILLTNEPGVSVIGQNFFKEYSYEIDGFYVRLSKAPYVETANEDADAKPAKTAVSVVSKSPPSKTVTNAAVSVKPVKTDKYSVPFAREGNVMFVDIMVNGRSTKAIFDTGCAPDGIVMPQRFVDKLGIQTNSDGYYAETVEIGPISRKYARVHFADGLHELLIGPKFFGDRRYIVDSINSVIKFQY